MKKITNKLLFSGLAVIFVLLVGGTIASFYALRDNKTNDAEDDTQKVETRSMESFNAIENNGICNIVYVQSDKSAVEITAPDKYISRIETDVDNGVLRIDISGRLSRNNNAKIDIKVYSPTCRSIKNSGIGKISCDSLCSDTLIVKNEGAGSIELKKLSVSQLKADNEGIGSISADVIDAEYVRLDNEGTGSISISGKAETAKFINEGVGKIDASDLDCKDIGFFNEGLGKVITKK